MSAYIEDVLEELEAHHQRQSAAITALNELRGRKADFKAGVVTRLVNQAKAALNELDCVDCKQLATDFVGETRPTA